MDEYIKRLAKKRIEKLDYEIHEEKQTLERIEENFKKKLDHVAEMERERDTLRDHLN